MNVWEFPISGSYLDGSYRVQADIEEERSQIVQSKGSVRESVLAKKIES